MEMLSKDYRDGSFDRLFENQQPATSQTCYTSLCPRTFGNGVHRSGLLKFHRPCPIENRPRCPKRVLPNEIFSRSPSSIETLVASTFESKYSPSEIIGC
jgi:hypothetical protein